MPTSRDRLATSVVNGKIYCIGGTSIDGTELEMYDPITDIWSKKEDMPTPRNTLTSAVIKYIV